MLESTTVNIQGIITMTKKSLFCQGALALLLSVVIPAVATAQTEAATAQTEVATAQTEVATAQTLDRIRSEGTVNIGFVKDAPPFSSVSSGGGAEGYSIDLCKLVVEKLKSSLSVSSLNVDYKATSVSDGLDMVADGSVDVLCGSVTDTLDRRERVSFSIAVYNGGMGVLVGSNADKALLRVLKGEVAHTGPIWRSTINQGLADHTYAVHAGTVTEEYVREKIAGLGVQATIIAVDDHETGVDMVAEGKADAYFGDRPILRKVMAGHADSDDLMLLDRYFTYEPIALVMARNNDDFRLVVDTALSELYSSDEFPAMYARHFGQPGEKTLRLFEIYARR